MAVDSILTTRPRIHGRFVRRRIRCMRLKRLAIGAVAVAGVAWMATPGVGLASSRDSEVPRYQHIVEIMMENQTYGTIIGSSQAPKINALANQYGLATN